MPKGTKILSVTPSGASAWVHSVCIEAGLPDGGKKLYFMKVSLTYTPLSVLKHRVLACKRLDSLFQCASPVSIQFHREITVRASHTSDCCIKLLQTSTDV